MKKFTFRDYVVVVPTTREQMTATGKFLLILACIILFSVIITSCESKSGHLAEVRATTKPEKVVIIDSYPNDPNMIQATIYRYKVKRVEHGVVTVIGENEKYEIGDTIYCKFKN